MAYAGVENGGAINGKGTLWAKVDNEGKNTLSLKKAFFLALWVELAMIIGFTSIDFDKHWKEVKDSKVLRAVPVELPPEVKEEPPEEVKPPPPPPKEQKPQEKPKEDVKEAAPIEVDAPPASVGSASSVSVPETVGEVSQGAGKMTEAPAPPPPPPPAPAGPRSIAAITNRNECMAALIAGYPREARRASQEGSLTALVTVEPSGQVAKVEITRANPRRVFEKALTAGLMSSACRFTPDPVGYQAIVPFEYRLSGESSE